MTKHSTSAAIPFRPRKAAPVAPAHLSAEAAAWWQQTQIDFDLEPHHVKVLTLAAECLDRCVDARGEIAVAGIVVTDRFGQQKAHPACQIEATNKALFARLLRELQLDAPIEGGLPRPTSLR